MEEQKESSRLQDKNLHDRMKIRILKNKHRNQFNTEVAQGKKANQVSSSKLLGQPRMKEQFDLEREKVLKEAMTPKQQLDLQTPNFNPGLGSRVAKQRLEIMQNRIDYKSKELALNSSASKDQEVSLSESS